MFTGIVEATGLIRDVEDLRTTRRFRVEAPALAARFAPGDSVAVDGACQTVVEADAEGFAVDVIGTTLERTLAAGYAEGARVNLERALAVGGRLDGHLVQGHVDGLGHLIRCDMEGEFWLMDFRLPEDVARLTVERGSIAVNGVSLTVNALPSAGVCRVGVIPFTYRETNLGDLNEGAPVNVEGDLIGKYVGKVLAGRAR
jgi:riboflavin synthase